MSRLLLLSLTIFFNIAISTGQFVDIVWEKSFGGTMSDEGFAICEGVDSGYVFLGFANSLDGDLTFNAGLQDIWVIHTNIFGDIIWQKTIGGSGNDCGLSINKTIDSGYIIAGRTISNDGDVGVNYGGQDCWIIKLNSVGEIVWKKVVGGNKGEEAHSIIQTIDGGFIFTGFSNSNTSIFTDHIGSTDYKDLIIVKLNTEGEVEWSKSYGGDDNDMGYQIIQSADSNFLVAGFTTLGVTFDYDYWILKIDTLGNILWQKSYGGSDGDRAFTLAEINSNRIIVTGETDSGDGDITDSHGSSDAWTLMLNGDGEIVWKKSYGGSSAEYGSSIFHNLDGTITFGGLACSPNDGDVEGHHGLTGHGDYWLVNIDTLGVLRWQKCLGGVETDFANAAIATSDTAILLTGYAWSNDGDVTGHHGEPGPFTGPDAWTVKVKVNCNLLAYYPDTDGDSFGADEGYIYSCNDTSGFVLNNLDCDDTNADINPSVLLDACNSTDDNCNGLLDEDALFLTWYLDSDVDGFGNNAIDSLSCFELTGYVFNNTDCDDANNSINPGALEICNDVDENCNLLIDEDLVFTNYYMDADGDNYGYASIDTLWCASVTGYVADSTDCNDADPDIYPGAEEILNGFDDNCNKLIDEGLTVEDLLMHTVIVYPNPTDEWLYMEWFENSPSHFQILNIAGEMMISQTKNFPVNKIDVSLLPSGIYFIKFNEVRSGISFIKE